MLTSIILIIIANIVDNHWFLGLIVFYVIIYDYDWVCRWIGCRIGCGVIYRCRVGWDEMHFLGFVTLKSENAIIKVNANIEVLEEWLSKEQCFFFEISIIDHE